MHVFIIVVHYWNYIIFWLFLLIKLSSELIFFPIKEKYLKELLMEPFKGAEYVRGGTVKFFAIPRPNIIFLKGLANERH